MRSTKLVLIVVTVIMGIAVGACSKGPETAGPNTPATKSGAVVLPSSTSTSTVPGPATTPPGTVWAGAPEPCALATDRDVRQLTRFDVDNATRPGQTPSGAATKVCLFKNRYASIQGGSVTITILPPGTNFELDQANVTDLTPIAGVGVKAYAGHFRGNPTGGQGLTTALVDMGNGGFSIGAFVHADLAPDDVANLARVVAKNWKVGQ